VIDCSFEEIQEKVQSNFDFPIELASPYKLCDYRPTYGEVFEDDIEGYDFWGYCDVDLIFGNIRKFITDDILLNHDRILALGHFSLFRNSEGINRIYRDSIGTDVPYKRIYASPKHFGFDEHGKNKLYDLFYQKKIKTYINNTIFADIVSFYKHFVSSYARKLVLNHELQELEENENWKGKAVIFSFNNGELIKHVYKNDNHTHKEYMYVHFQKRKLTVPQTSNYHSFVMSPNKFTFVQSLTVDKIKFLATPSLFPHRRVKRRLYLKVRLFIYKYMNI
jgi:hypothetical protein